MTNTDYYNEIIADSDPARTRQAAELDTYLSDLCEDTARFAELFHPDFSSPDNYLAST